MDLFEEGKQGSKKEMRLGSLFGNKIKVAVGSVVAVIGLVLLYFAVVINIAPGHVGIVFAKFGSTPLADRIIVEEGQKGVWREPLMPGTHFFWLAQRLWNYTIEEVPMVVIKNDEVGLVEAQDGSPLEPGQILAKDDSVDDKGNFRMGQKGTRDKVLTPGQYPINPKYLKVSTIPAVIIQAGKIGIVERKTGDQPPAGTILVPQESGYRGIQREVLPNGTYYLNPKKVKVDIVDATLIEKGKIGIVTKKVGKIPPEGTILVKAEDEYQGIQEEILQPGMYYVNPYEKEVKIVDAINVPDGQVGVVISKVGQTKPESQLLAKEGQRGIQEVPLSPGFYYLNPYQFDVVVFDCRQQKYEMNRIADQGDTPGDDSISFLSNDGFVINFDLTIIYKVEPADAPFVVATVGRDIKAVREIEIRPSARNYARIYGSMRNGEEFVHGETREKFQKSMEEAMQIKARWNKVQIVQAQVQHFEVPGDLRDPITKKVIATKLQQQYEQEQETQKANANLAREKERVIFEQKKVVAETTKKEAEIKAEQERDVAQIEKSKKEFEADGDAKKKRIAAEAELFNQQQIAAGTLANKQAEASGQKMLVDAWSGTGAQSLVAFELAKVMKGATILPLDTFFGGKGGGSGIGGDKPIGYYNTVDLLNFFKIGELINRADRQPDAPAARK